MSKPLPATRRLLHLCSVLVALSLYPALSTADDLSGGALPPMVPTAGPDAELTGTAIYQRVLDNTYDSFIQTSSLYSGDRGGNEQWTSFKIWFQNEQTDGAPPPDGGVVSKSRVQYMEPFEIRNAGYLVLARTDRVNDQFVYMPTQRRVKRVNLRGEPVFGSDFSFEDLLPREIEDADYHRRADARTLGRDCFVIEAIPQKFARSEYSRMVVHIDKERSIPLLTRYWSDRGVEVKELKADPDTVELIEGVWIVKRMTMRHLKLETYTRLEVASIQGNAELNDTLFELRRLESRGR